MKYLKLVCRCLVVLWQEISRVARFAHFWEAGIARSDRGELSIRDRTQMVCILNEPHSEDWFSKNDDDSSASYVASLIAKELTKSSMTKRINGMSVDYPVSLIGLNGSWGSGKSNVLKRVMNMLSSPPLTTARREKSQSKFIFFEYDFWGHRQDLTRKMFLEELVGFLCDKKGALGKKEIREVKELTGKKMELKHRRRWDIPAIMFITVYPVLSLMVSMFKIEFDYKLTAVRSVIQNNLWIVLGGLVALLAVLWLVANGIRGFMSRALVREDFEHVIEPSVGEFTEFLAKMAGILKKNNKTLVIVLDNIDRLLPEDVMQCLAAVHILFAETGKKRPSNLKVIVPYDAPKIGNLFAKMMNTDSQAADDYFRRTFDVVYQLSPQFASRWERFFDTCYDIVAANDHTANKDKDEVRRVLDYLVPVAERTPRRLINILNEIAVIRNAMKGIVDDATNLVRMKDIAVYACVWPKCGLRAMRLSSRDGKDATVDEKGGSPTQVREDLKTIDDLILDGGFIANSNYRDFLYAEDNKAKLAIAAIVYQVKDTREIILPKFLLPALTSGDPDRTGELSCMPGFLTAFRSVVMNDINIGNVDKVPRALEGLRTDQQARWDEFYVAQKEALMTLHQSNATMLQEFERIVLKNISDWAQYAKKLRDKSEDLPKMLAISNSIESTLREIKRTLVNSVEVELVSPGAFMDLLTVFERGYKLTNQCCDWKALDEHCVERVGAKEKWRYLYALRFLAHDKAIRLVETRKKIENCEIPMEMPLLDYYLGILENVTDGQVSCKLNDSVCDVYTKWMQNPDNLVRYRLCNDNMECRVVALALRYGGSPWKVKEIDELINKKNGWESVCVEDELPTMLDHYFSRSDLLRRLQELNRPEPLFQNMLNLLKKDSELTRKLK